MMHLLKQAELRQGATPNYDIFSYPLQGKHSRNQS
jgi:hypothetical protein